MARHKSMTNQNILHIGTRPPFGTGSKRVPACRTCGALFPRSFLKVQGNIPQRGIQNHSVGCFAVGAVRACLLGTAYRNAAQATCSLHAVTVCLFPQGQGNIAQLVGYLHLAGPHQAADRHIALGVFNRHALCLHGAKLCTAQGKRCIQLPGLQLIRIQAAEGKVCLYAFGFQCTKVSAAQVQIQLYLFQFYLRQGDACGGSAGIILFYILYII